MKKIVLSFLSVCLLAGCSNRQDSVISAEPEEEVKQFIWVMEPTLEVGKIKDLQTVTYPVLTVNTTNFGEVSVTMEMEHNESDYLYIIAETDNKQGIYDYEGNEIYPISLNTVNTPGRRGITSGYQDGQMVYGMYNTSTAKAIVFSNDFSSTSEVDNFVYNPTGDGTAKPFLAVQNGVIGIVGMQKNEAGQRIGWAFEAIDASLLTARTVVTNVDAVCNDIGKVIYDPSSGSVIGISTSATYVDTSFANGYYVISSGNYASLVEASSGQSVAIDYNDLLYMQDGYIPAKKNGKWGFLDASGYEVTDFIFDEATPLHDGKSYVSIDGKFGILDVQKLLSAGTEINMSNIYDVEGRDAIGSVTVNVYDLIMHDTPEVGTMSIGTCRDGATYHVYETQTDENYTWYRINEYAWIAGTDEWVTYQEGK